MGIVIFDVVISEAGDGGCILDCAVLLEEEDGRRTGMGCLGLLE